MVDPPTVCVACVSIFSTSRFERLMARLVRHLAETKCPTSRTKHEKTNKLRTLEFGHPIGGPQSLLNSSMQDVQKISIITWHLRFVMSTKNKWKSR